MGVLAADSLGWIVADNRYGELHLRAPTGEITRIVRWATRRRAVTPADFERDFEFRLSQRPDPGWHRQMRAAIDAHPAPPDSMPAFGSNLFIDSDRNIWVDDYVPRAEQAPSRYQVLDASGQWLGAVTMPDGVEALSIGNGHMVGRRVDALGVETVVVHRIVGG
jgi:hypothetical protein